jgi:hypothetical protein
VISAANVGLGRWGKVLAEEGGASRTRHGSLGERRVATSPVRKRPIAAEDKA